jgi:hypothetical protein
MEAVEDALSSALARGFGLTLSAGAPGIAGPGGATEQ